MKKLAPLSLIIIILSAILLFPLAAGGQHAYAAGGEVYLTFDDGPCCLTPEILNILSSYNIKATFFVVGNMAVKYPHIIRETAVGGHTIGLHCYTHDYKEIYKDTAHFTEDIIKCRLALKKILPDYKVEYYRFPGGSFGLSKKYIDAVSALNLKYKDWNAVNGDAQNKVKSVGAAVQCAIETAAGRRRVVLLMHDNKSVTAAALPGIIEYFLEEGYVFKAF